MRVGVLLVVVGVVGAGCGESAPSGGGDLDGSTRARCSGSNGWSAFAGDAGSLPACDYKTPKTGPALSAAACVPYCGGDKPTSLGAPAKLIECWIGPPCTNSTGAAVRNVQCSWGCP
jgi:hypothetical protein